MTSSRRLLPTLFAIYLVLLTWVVMWKLEVPQVGGGVRNVKLTPFVSSDGDGASQPMEIWANLLLFVPFGVHAVLLTPASSRWKVMIAAAATSGALEVAQYVLAVGRTDITDVIVNCAGAAAGVALVALVQHGIGARSRQLLARACLAGTALALVGCATFAISPVRYGPPDVACDQLGPCRVFPHLTR